jgi:hypothetical protein
MTDNPYMDEPDKGALGPSVCPNCSYDAAFYTRGGSKFATVGIKPQRADPHVGDTIICGGCKKTLIVTEDLSVRLVTDEEQIALDARPFAQHRDRSNRLMDTLCLFIEAQIAANAPSELRQHTFRAKTMQEQTDHFFEQLHKT